MNPKSKTAKRLSSRKIAHERVFSATFDVDGRLTNVSFRGTVPTNCLNRPHVRKLVVLMFGVGKALAASRGGTKPASIQFGTKNQDKNFYDAVLRYPKKCDWFEKLFGIKQAADSPFSYAHGVLRLVDTQTNEPIKNAPTKICITIGSKTIDSRTSEPVEFDDVPRAPALACNNRNYAAALGKVVAKATAEFSKSLSEHSYPVSDPFKHAGEVMRTIGNTPGLRGVDMHLMSVIPPSAWFQVNDWTDHHEKVRTLAAKPGDKKSDRRQRRIHALDENILAKPEELILLADMMLFDHFHHIESQVLAVSQGKADPVEGISSVDGLLLMDYGIFSTGTGEYGIILSDIQPFGINAPTKFQVSHIPKSDRQALYYFLRHTWHKAWWPNNVRGASIRYTVDILKLVRELPGETNLGMMPSLWFFKKLNGAKGGVLAAVKNAVTRLMEDAQVTSGNQDELKFREWFTGKGKDFWNSLNV